jgi:retron-type reverse transcriptase
MSLFPKLLTWVKSLFGQGPRTREVTRLSSQAGAPVDASGRVADAVTEEVVTKGPLKEKHRRLVRRDPRLLPKPGRTSSWRKPKKVMSASEAGRLFSGTLRTRNRNLRDLLPDEAQLEHYGLPVWRTEEDVASVLGLTVRQLRHYSVHRERDRVSHYLTFSLPKRSGGQRLIHAPKSGLKAVQRKLLALLGAKLPVSPHAHGFVKGRSVRTGAEGHVGKAAVLRLDLKDFFHTVTYVRVRGLLIALGYGYPVAAALAVLMTESERQPVEVDGKVYFVPVSPRVCVQGAPTSPALCNAVVLRLDRRLAGLARKHGFTYSRYADDLSFSGPDVKTSEKLRALAVKIIQEEGFQVNAAKTRLQRRGGRQTVTGVTVNQVLGLSRKERRKLRAMIHQEGTKPASAEASARIDGKLAWLSMLNPQQAEALRTRRKAPSR